MRLTLPPAQNAVPAPVISSAPTSGFSPQVLIMVRSAAVRSSDSALRNSGRLSVMTATRPRSTHSNSSVPVSTAISVSTRHSSLFVVLELLDPRPQLHFPGPGAARLLQHIPVTQGNGIGIEHRIRPVGRLATRCAANAAIDNEMRDVDALRSQFACHALRKPAQRELAHRKRRGLRIAPYAC